MSGIAGDIKDMLSIKFKPRHDAYTDQFSRIFMMKIMLLGCLIIGLNWYNDDIHCILPSTNELDDGFAQQACWINGLYVYEEIRYHENEMGYYGIPRELAEDGKFKDHPEHMCQVRKTQSNKLQEGCEPMKKTFFLQYQYMVFFVAILAMMYYFPYLLFKMVNVDLISLKVAVEENNAKEIIDSYFDYKINPRGKMQRRIVLNIFVKILYLAVNVLTFYMMDGVLNYKFKAYGGAWIEWSKLPNVIGYDYMGQRLTPKPGNELLPSFGICEVLESAKDVKHERMNTHKLICEMSTHILYQYMLVLMWFAMIAGMAVAALGLLLQLIDHLWTITVFLRIGSDAKMLYKKVTLRECEYLEYIRRKNLVLYAAVIREMGKIVKERDQEIPMYNDSPPPFRDEKKAPFRDERKEPAYEETKLD